MAGQAKTSPPEDKRLPFWLTGLIERLEAQGFRVGVDRHVRAAAVLDAFGYPCDPDRLKYLLCPVFATSEKEQKIFHREFESIRPLFEGPGDDALDKPVSDGTKSKKRRKKSEEGEQRPRKEAAAPKKKPLFITGVLLFILLAAGSFLWGEYRRSKMQTVPDIKITQKTKIINKKTLEFKTVNIDIPPNFDPDRPRVETFFQRYRDFLRFFGAMLPWIVLLLYEWHRQKRRGMVLDKKAGKRPTYVLPVRVEPQTLQFLSSEEFARASARLRRRVAGEESILDVGLTLRETVEKGGFPQFCYKGLSRPPEYLVLIDIPSFTSHQVGLFEAIVEKLHQDGMFASRYFFRRDPRLCFQKAGEKHETLDDLVCKFRERRLIVFSNGYGMLDPETGRMGPWTEMFSAFAQRAVLTPEAPATWGMKEVYLSRDFVLLPSTSDGLAAMVDFFEERREYDPGEWVRADLQNGAHDIGYRPNMVELKKVLRSRDEDKPEGPFQWLCACAVYPELNWRLTLSLGEFCMRPKNVSEEDLLKIVRLPWFAKGCMDDRTRETLIDELGESDLLEIREKIFDLIPKKQEWENEASRDWYRLNIAVHKWMLDPKDRKKLDELKERIRSMDERDIVRDAALVRLLESTKTPRLALKVPEWFRKRLFRKGVPLFGLQRKITAAATAFACAAIFFGVSWLIPPTTATGSLKGGSISLEFVLLGPGDFVMGSPKGEPNRDNDEDQQKAIIENPFYMQTKEISQKQWETVMGNNPSYNKGCDGCPVEKVSWNDAQNFIERLNKLGAGTFRLPWEAEWEYAARAGTSTPFAFGDCLSTDDANYNGEYPLTNCPEGEYRKKTIETGTLRSNSWGLYDMHGNVYEWCQDVYQKKASVFNQNTGVIPDNNQGSVRVLRGGSWNDLAWYCRSAYRFRYSPDYRNDDVGFRLVLLP